VNFTEHTLIRTWHGDGFRIELHQSPHPPALGCWWAAYRVFDDAWAGQTGRDALVFAGDGLNGIGTALDPPTAVRALCDYLSLQPGDIAAGYFRTYTPDQLAWREARAHALARYGSHPAPPAPSGPAS
jgi:hypothetical protein